MCHNCMLSYSNVCICFIIKKMYVSDTFACGVLKIESVFQRECLKFYTLYLCIDCCYLICVNLIMVCIVYRFSCYKSHIISDAYLYLGTALINL